MQGERVLKKNLCPKCFKFHQRNNSWPFKILQGLFIITNKTTQMEQQQANISRIDNANHMDRNILGHTMSQNTHYFPINPRILTNVCFVQKWGMTATFLGARWQLQWVCKLRRSTLKTTCWGWRTSPTEKSKSLTDESVFIELSIWYLALGYVTWSYFKPLDKINQTKEDKYCMPPFI